MSDKDQTSWPTALVAVVFWLTVAAVCSGLPLALVWLVKR